MTGAEEPDRPSPPPRMVPFAEWEVQQQAAQAPPEDEHQDQEDNGAAIDPERTSDLSAAILRAAAWSIPPALAILITAPMTASSARTHFVQAHAWAAEPPSPPPYLAWLLAIGGVCWLICTVAELMHAARLAGEYPPLGPWARLGATPAQRAVRRAAARIDHRMGAGGGCLGLAALGVAGPVVVLAWSALTAAAAPLWIAAVGGATIAHLTTVI